MPTKTTPDLLAAMRERVRKLDSERSTLTSERNKLKAAIRVLDPQARGGRRKVKS